MAIKNFRMFALCNFCCSKMANHRSAAPCEFLNLKVLNKVCVSVAAGTKRYRVGPKKTKPNLISFTALTHQRVKVTETNSVWGLVRADSLATGQMFYWQDVCPMLVYLFWYVAGCVGVKCIMTAHCNLPRWRRLTDCCSQQKDRPCPSCLIWSLLKNLLLPFYIIFPMLKLKMLHQINTIMTDHGERTAE